jgi:hypothetical protein
VLLGRDRAVTALLVVASLVACPAFGAEPAPSSASGKFAGHHKSFGVTGAYAFWSRSSDSGPMIEVAVSNDGFKISAFDAFYDPRPVIDDRFVDDQTAVVYFEFEPGGKYHGLSYYFGSGDGCGYCYDSKVQSTVRLASGRISGKLAYKTDNYSFDIQFDAPMPPQEWGKPISGDGGEVGAAYRAYSAAMEKEDRKAVFELLDSENQEIWKEAEQKGRADEQWNDRLEKEHWRLKEARIAAGYVRGDQAVLLIQGRSTLLDHIHGQVTLTREKGRWKIGDEVLQVGE